MKDWTTLDSQIVMYALSEENKDQESHRKAWSIIKKHGDHLAICPLIAFELLQNVQLNSDEIEQRTAFCSSQISPAYDLLSAQFAAEIRRRIRQERDRGNTFAGNGMRDFPNLPWMSRSWAGP
jgi:predicted nucleic acid-binding protein